MWRLIWMWRHRGKRLDGGAVDASDLEERFLDSEAARPDPVGTRRKKSRLSARNDQLNLVAAARFVVFSKRPGGMPLC
jgi:hypothetical protein